MKNTKRKLVFFAPYDYDGMTAHFEQMALDGWLIQSVNGNLWKYKKIEPQKLKFAVTHFENYTLNEAAPDNGEGEFLEMCASSGWQLVAKCRTMMVFATDSENAVPIETDAVTQLKNTHKIMKSTIIQSNLAMCIILFWNVFEPADNLFSEPETYVDYPAFLLAIPCFAIILIGEFFTTYDYIKWYKKAKSIVEEQNVFWTGETNSLTYVLTRCMPYAILVIVGGLVVPTLTTRSIDLWTFNPMFVTGVFVSVLIAITVYTKLFNANIKTPLLYSVMVFTLSVAVVAASLKFAGFTLKEQKSTPQIVTTEKHRQLEVYSDSLPFTVESLGGQIQQGKSCSYKYTAYKSALFDKFTLVQGQYDMQSAEMQSMMNCKIVHSDAGWFIDKLQSRYRNHGSTLLDADSWQAEKAAMSSYEYTSGAMAYSYYIFYEDMIMFIEMPMELNQQQVDVIVDTFRK